MTLDQLLFGLRLVSALLLLAILLALLVALWRDYQSAALHTQASRRVYGQLVALTQLEAMNMYAPTGETYPLLPLTSLGRSLTNTIVIEDNFASSEHAVIALRNTQWWLEDRNSRNGTLLNGEPITKPVIVTDGDIIGIGKISYKLQLDTHASE